MKNYLILVFLGISSFLVAQESTATIEEEISVNRFIDGTLLTPINPSNTLAILIAGSGPTDRNGNQNFMKNNALKKIAIALAKNGIATFRYDKRIVKQIRKNNVDKDILFDDFITDAISVVDYFKEQNIYKKIVLIGHSQGSLVGMVAAQKNVDAFVSLAGAGQPIDNVILDQINNTAPMYTTQAKRVFTVLRAGKTTTTYPKELASVFDISLQPFMQSWMKYNPTEEIKKLKMPILIINGTKDLQVPVTEAESLAEANPEATLKIIEKMNHVLFKIEGDRLENAKSYNESFRELDEDLVHELISFLKK